MTRDWSIARCEAFDLFFLSIFLMGLIRSRKEKPTIVVIQDGNRDLSDSRKERLLPEGAQGSSLCLVYCCGVGYLEPQAETAAATPERPCQGPSTAAATATFTTMGKPSWAAAFLPPGGMGNVFLSPATAPAADGHRGSGPWGPGLEGGWRRRRRLRVA